jgi:mRNA-degrading endonuclease RelE of RelBE toxin-antitoxin system
MEAVMVWMLNKNGKTPIVPLNATEQKNLNTFMNNIRAGQDPKSAADDWDSDYKMLAGRAGVWQIRLSQGKRVMFEVNQATQVVKILEVGGHT